MFSTHKTDYGAGGTSDGAFFFARRKIDNIAAGNITNQYLQEMSPEEEKVWRSIQQKDGQAFETYYKAHYRLFFLASLNYLKDPRLAQEVVNDVFIKIWEDGHSISIQASLKSYLHQAVVNRSLNLLDKDKRDRQHRQEPGYAPQVTSESREMETNELRLRLHHAIDQLPEQCRKVFKMSRFEELKRKEIAVRLGISVKTVKNHIAHALKQLSKTLGDWNDFPLWILLIKIFFYRCL